ncbi:DUF2069 domain-containing protein [Uliginosibacterium sp. H3]|uniref:DUF2069 domain-containing protein n=1 Tax=Uliginosibacterium silvisoli TaxID=3114758 RepID=A0ABU6K3C7_9RHOO|nr:DUF2069 domain-containing protein [Uliginosibacterium sp. H3]
MKRSKTATPVTPEFVQQCATRARGAQTIGIAALLALIALGLAWELHLVPMRPGASWLALKTAPLAAALPGFFSGKRYTFQWMSLLVWIYFTEGIVSATSSGGAASVVGWIETALTVVLFIACAIYARMTESWRRVG